MASGGARLAVDIGGTFTDVVLATADGLETVKVLTTHEHPAQGVMTGLGRVLEQSGAAPEALNVVIHGTTLATNALIERRGAKTALITTEGHRDVLEMAFENRFEQYDINIDRPRPLVPRALRLPVPERITANGAVLTPLDESALEDIVAVLQAEAVESVAIGFLHGYANDRHERRTAEILGRTLPELSITLASEVCPEIREFERFSTACANAYVKPLMAQYLSDLEARLTALGVQCPFLMMTSGGGLTSLDTAREFPIRLVESGPAGGAILAADIARALNLPRVLSFDMGGTTAKICLIDDFEPQHSRAFEVDRSYRFKKGSGLPVRIPVIEMVEIGAGGGSIASVDRLGRLQVGPESAGSQPGPAAYGRGGLDATVTDADVVLGRLEPKGFAGGRMPLEAAAAGDAVQRGIGEPLEIQQARDAAFAISEIVDENMAAASRAHAAEWGKDLHGRTLIAYGGAAPLHAVRLLQKLELDAVVVPVAAGVGSAVGFLAAPISYEVVRSRYMRLSAGNGDGNGGGDGGFDAEQLRGIMADMRAEARAVIGPISSDGSDDGDGGGPDHDPDHDPDRGPDRGHAIRPGHLAESCRAYMRYVGQGYEVVVDFEEPATEQSLRTAFERVYTALYGRLIADLDVEVLSWTLTLATPKPHLAMPEPAATVAPDLEASGPLYDGEAWHEAPRIPRASIPRGHVVQGPATIVEEQTTIVLPASFEAEVHARGDVVIRPVRM